MTSPAHGGGSPHEPKNERHGGSRFKFVFLILGIGAAFFACVTMWQALIKPSAPNVGVVEIEALLLFVIAAVFLVGAGVIDAMGKRR